LQHGGKLTGAVKAASPADVGIGDIPVPDLPPGTWDDFWGKGGGGRAEGGSGDVSSSSASSSGRSTSLRRVSGPPQTENAAQLESAATGVSGEKEGPPGTATAVAAGAAAGLPSTATTTLEERGEIMMPSPAEDVTTTPPEEAHEEMSPSAQLVFGNGNGGGGGGSECVLSPVSAVSGGAWGAPRDPPAVDGRSPGGSETAEVDMMDFLQEVGQQRLRDEAREEHVTEAMTAAGTPVSAAGSVTEFARTPAGHPTDVGPDNNVVSGFPLQQLASVVPRPEDSAGGDSQLSAMVEKDEDAVKDGLQRILHIRRTAQESVDADAAADAAKANDFVPGENGGDFRATLPFARTEAAAAAAGGPAAAAVRAEPRLLAASWSHVNQDRSRQPRGGPKTPEERLKAIEDAKAALRSRVALRKASQSEQASLQEFVNQQGTTSRRPVSLGRSELGSSSPISSSFGGSASAIGSRSSRGGDLDISVGARGGGGQTPTFAVTHPAYGEQSQQQQQQAAASDAGGVTPSGGLAGVYDDDDDDDGGTAPASSGGAEAADQGLGSSDGASGCAAGASGGNAAVEEAAAAAMALEAGDMTLSGGGAVVLASPGKDRGVSDGEAPGGLLMTGRRGRVHLSGSYTEAAAAAVAGAAAAAAKASSSSISPTNKSAFGTPPRVARSGSASEGRSFHSPPPGPLLVHPQRRQAARQNRSGLRINTSSSGDESAGEKAGRQQQQQQQQALDRSQLPRSPTAESRKLSKEAAEYRAGGDWVQVELPPGAVPAAAAAAVAAAPAGSGGKQNAEHSRNGGGGSDFAWSKVGAFPFGQG
ncbi:unnamed protein product, partial [Ectocarpus sp. 8 AP-2014]